MRLQRRQGVAQRIRVASERRADAHLVPERSHAGAVVGVVEPAVVVGEHGDGGGEVSAETLEFTSRLIEKKLSDFGVAVKVLAAYPGPVITRYEIEPAVGVKGSQIVNLVKDLARALSVVSIRVVETIPGKNFMNISGGGGISGHATGAVVEVDTRLQGSHARRRQRHRQPPQRR